MIDTELLIEEQSQVYDFMKSNFEEVNGLDFYRELFPDNQSLRDLEAGIKEKFQSNSIFVYKNGDVDFLNCKDHKQKKDCDYDQDEADKGKMGMYRRIMYKDLWEKDFISYVECNTFALCGGLTYLGRRRSLENAHKMNALIIDLDAVGYDEIRNLVYRIGKPANMIRSLPIPTYLALSGTGVHLYYFLEEPIDLYPNIKEQLKSLKHELTFRIWDYGGTTKMQSIQYQSINQGFRMVGSINAKYNKRVKAFKTGDRVSLKELNEYVNEDNKVDITKKYKPTKHTLKEAKEKFPEWYQRVVVEGNKEFQKWSISRDLYDWWLRKKEQVVGGHRYYYLMCLAIYAYKCDVSYEEFEKDVWSIYDEIKAIPHTNPFKESDVASALEVYNLHYYNFRREDIALLSGISIEPNKRNYRTQEQHLERARLVQGLDYPNGEWRNKEGRPKGSGTKENLVREYVENNPEDNPTEIARNLKISRPTVYKYLKLFKEEKKLIKDAKKITGRIVSEEQINKVKELINSNPGKVEVYLLLKDQQYRSEQKMELSIDSYLKFKKLVEVETIEIKK